MATLVAVAAVVVLAAVPAARAGTVSQLFWTNNASGDVGAAGADGTDVEETLVTGGSSVALMTLDSNYLYCANSGSGSIGRASLDGSGAIQNFITGLADP